MALRLELEKTLSSFYRLEWMGTNSIRAGEIKYIEIIANEQILVEISIWPTVGYHIDSDEINNWK